MDRYYKTEDEIRALVSSFETCSFHPSEFRHYQHLTVALWYMWHHSLAEATARMTSGIRKLAETYGKTGYHETITLFWLRVVANFAAEHRHEPIPAAANALIDSYDDKDFIRQYYSAELLASSEAKAEWIEPDLKPLPQIAEGVPHPEKAATI